MDQWDLSKTHHFWPENGFTIWYADGSKVEGTTIEDWENAPSEGILYVLEIIKIETIDDRKIVYSRRNLGSDWYWTKPNFGIDHAVNPITTNDPDTWIELNLPDGCLHPKKGKWTTDEHWAEIKAEVDTILNDLRNS